MKQPSSLAVVMLALGALSLSGCVGTAVGAGATAGIAVAQERSVGDAVTDTRIRAQINKAWFDHDITMFRKIGLSVVERRVVLTGAVEIPKMRVDAVRLAWKARGVKEVVNEIRVTDEGGVMNYVRDTWISTQLKTKLLVDKDIKSINYSIETVNGVVFVMGIAQNQAELDRVTNHARNLGYVRSVISHARLKDAPRRQS